jgi:hypothetical protein
MHQGLNHQITSKPTLLCLAWNFLTNSNFNIHFPFHNLFKCYKWKHDFEAYPIMY